MSNLNWLERRRKAARCKIHGLYYDPALTAGCTLCRKEGLLTKKHRGPQLVVLLLAILGMTVVAFRLFGPGGGIPSRFGIPFTLDTPAEPVETSTAARSKLDPENFRDTLQALESTLFKPQTADLDSAGAEIDVATDALSAQLLQQHPTDAQDVAAALAALGEDAKRSPFTLKQLEKIRDRWLRLRQRHFEPAPWLTVPETSPTALDPAMILAYREIAVQLSSLIQGSAAEAQASPVQPPDQAGAEEASEPWSERAQPWREKVDELRRRLPHRPGPQAPTSFLVVIQDLEKALEQLEALVATERARPPAGEQFEALTSKTDAARRSLDELLL